MHVERLGHAGVMVTTEEVCCLMDPVLVDPFDSGAVTFEPRLAIDRAAARARCNLVVLSHEHADHFCVRSLNLLDREALVFYPRGARLIELALARLGFRKARAVTPGREALKVADLRLVSAASDVPFPEMSVVFCHGDVRFWNLVDTATTDEIKSATLSECGTVDLLFAPFQPFIQEELSIDALGARFPFDTYGRLLRDVLDIRPRTVVPSACGVRYTADAWLNARGFPMTASQLLRDVSRVCPEIAGLLLAPGDEVTLRKGRRPRLRHRRTIVRPRGRPRAYDWRPDEGVPPLGDPNPFGRSPAELRREVARFLDDELLPKLEGTAGFGTWRARMERLDVTWRLEVVFPGAQREVRHLTFDRRRLRWATARRDAPFCMLHTSVTASTLVGLTTGEAHPDRAMLDVRRWSRLYEVHRGGVQRADQPNDDPLLRVLYPGAAERFVEHELRALGY